MTKHIKFVGANAEAYNTNIPPIPASHVIPDWYKKIPLEHSVEAVGRDRGTVKKCTPFVDALMTGYSLVLPFDLEIVPDGDNKHVRWQVERDNFLSVEEPYRVTGMKAPEGFSPTIFRFSNFPRIETPLGYSTLLTHPFNRYDLPFLTLSGVVDTDKLHQEVAVSFYLRTSFFGIIKKGTPIAQLMPFKRDNWEHENLEPYDEKKTAKTLFDVRSVIERSYKTQYWSKKSYK